MTASADCPDAFGYADFALGHLDPNDIAGPSVLNIIKRDWTMQRDECSRERWERVIRTRRIKEDTAHLLAEQVWPQNDGEDEDDDLAA